MRTANERHPKLLAMSVCSSVSSMVAVLQQQSRFSGSINGWELLHRRDNLLAYRLPSEADRKSLLAISLQVITKSASEPP